MFRKIGNSLLECITGIPVGMKRFGKAGSTPSSAAGYQSVEPDSLSKADCQRIVNEFGRAMAEIQRYSLSMPAAAGRGKNMYPRRFDRSRLPYPPEMIREAVRILLQYEKDPANIETLHLGLEYLAYFK